MGNTNIELFTDDQRLYFAKKTFIASGDVNSVRLAVEFDDTWANYPVRSGYFKYTGFGKPTIEREKSMGANNTCQIPHDVLENPGTLEVGVTGTSADGTQQKTTGLIKYRLHQGAKRPGITMSPTMDLFQQLVESVKTMTDPVTKYVKESAEAYMKSLATKIEADNSEYRAAILNAIEPVTLWENTEQVTGDDWDKAKKIDVDLSKYRKFIVLFYYHEKHLDKVQCYMAAEKGTPFTVYAAHGFNDLDDLHITKREFVIDDTGMSVGEAGHTGTSGGSARDYADFLIPYKIIGYAPIIDE